MPINRPSRELGAMLPASAKATDADVDKLRAAYAQLAAARLASALMQVVPSASPKGIPAPPVKEPGRAANPRSVVRPGSGLGGGFSGGSGGLGGGPTRGMGGLGENYGGL
jgi:hypothetical protein